MQGILDASNVYWFLITCVATSIQGTLRHDLADKENGLANSGEPKIKISTNRIRGLKVNVLTHSDITKTYFSATTNMGMLDSPVDAPGLAHFFVEQLLRTVPAGENNNILERIQTLTNSDIRYFVTNDTAHCSFISETDIFEQILGPVADHICNFKLPEHELETRKKLFNYKLMGIQDLLDSKMLFGVLIPSIAKRDTNIQRRFIGSKQTIDSISYSDLIDFRKKLYTRENTTITVVTPLKIDAISELIESYFEDLPSNSGAFSDAGESVYDCNFRYISGSYINEQLREEFRNKIVLFRNHQYVSSGKCPKFMYIVIPLLSAFSKDHHGLFSLLESTFSSYQRDAIISILRKFGYAYDFSMGIELSAKSSSHLWLEISLAPTGYEWIEAVVLVFRAIFSQIRRACFSNLEGFINSCCRAVYSDASRVINNLAIHKAYSQRDRDEIYNLFSRAANFIENTDIEKIKNCFLRLGNNEPMRNDFTESYLKSFFNQLCSSKNWIVAVYSANNDLKLYEHLGQTIYLGAEERLVLNDTLKRKIEKRIITAFDCYFKSETHSIELLPDTTDTVYKNKFSVMEMCTNILRYYECLPNVKFACEGNNITAYSAKGSYMLRMAADALCAMVSINSCTTLNLFRGAAYGKCIPEIKLRMTFDDFHNEDAKTSTMFAIFIAYKRFENRFFKRVRRDGLSVSLSMSLHATEIIIKATETDICYYCLALLDAIGTVGTKEISVVNPDELAFARQYFINMLFKERYGISKLENLLNFIQDPLRPVCRHEFDILNCITTLEARHIYVRRGVRLLMESCNISLVDEIFKLYEDGIRIFSMQNIKSSINKNALKLKMIECSNQYQVRSLSSLSSCSIFISTFSASIIPAAELFLRYFYDSLFNDFIRKRMLGDLAVMHVGQNVTWNGGFLLIGMQSCETVETLKNALYDFLEQCRITAADYNQMASLFALDTDKNGIELYQIMSALSGFLNELPKRHNHCFVVSETNAHIFINE